MKAIDAVKSAAASAGVPTTHIGRAMGKRDNYVSAVASRGSTPQALAAMLDVCGYSLAAIPHTDLPESALVIDPPACSASGLKESE